VLSGTGNQAMLVANRLLTLLLSRQRMVRATAWFIQLGNRRSRTREQNDRHLGEGHAVDDVWPRGATEVDRHVQVSLGGRRSLKPYSARALSWEIASR